MNCIDLEIRPNAESLAIPGVIYIPDYINDDEHNQLLDIVDQQSWSIDSIEQTRKIQQHGYRLDYHQGFLVASTYLSGLPDWADKLATRFFNEGLSSTDLDQLTVNEYQPGQGVRSHIDCVTCFGKTIFALSLGGSCVMDFTHSLTKSKASILLSPGSLLVLKGESRYVWQHSVAPRHKDNYKGREIVRDRRISLTFREILFPHK
jgi:alkylated DNA repair dioxygenase AlkB